MPPAGSARIDGPAPTVPGGGPDGDHHVHDAPELLAPYLPRLSIDWLATGSDARFRVEHGTVVFVDISGFTKLSEGLARHGKVGAEELTATIGTCFVALLDLAVAYGGRLLKFGGDALLLYFSGPAHEARGCRAAVEMRRALRTVGRLTVLGQKVSLRMSVGVHSGDFHFFLVGESHRELVVTGPAASTTVAMEGTADAGQILVSPATAAALRTGLLGEAKGPGFLLRRAPEVPADSFVPFEPIPPGVDILHGIPVALRDTLRARHQEPEHRRVTVAFIHFDGTDDLVATEGPAEAADQLDELVRTVQRAADRNLVTFLATDVDHDGGKIILTAGAPSIQGDDEHRMLLALREVMDAGTRLPIRIGCQPRCRLRRGDRSSLPADVHGDGRRRQPGRTVDGQGVAGSDRGVTRRAEPVEHLLRDRGARAVPGQGEGEAGPGPPPGSRRR